MESIDAPTLKRHLLDCDEIALVDVREQGVYCQGHILLAVSIPLSRLELMIRDLVPRPATRVVLCDAAGGLADQAAAIMAGAGYSDVSILTGGIKAWAEAGFELFGGFNVVSKMFGEYVEHRFAPPRIAIPDLKAKMEAGEDVVIVDSRPFGEYTRVTIPGSTNLPGAELVYRLRDLVPDPKTPVVVNCGGRTRAIIGCQSLINAGIPNPVTALENGTMGWHLAGFDAEHGARRRAGPVSDGALDWARRAAADVARRFKVATITRGELARLRSDEARTLYLLDVRDPAEYAAGHLPGSLSAPGGQLVQATDVYVGTRNARLVLVDDTEVRAMMTASWLVQMGWPEVHVLAGGIGTEGLETGPRRAPCPEADAVTVDTVAVPELEAMIARGEALVVDFADSLAFRAGHIAGAWWAMRSRIEEALEQLPKAGTYVVTANDDRLALLAAADMAARAAVPVRVLDGGTAAWQAAGRPMATGHDNLAAEAEDLYYRPIDHESGVEEALQGYLDWEIALIDQLAEDGTLSFPDFAP
jgi:rhodanese-related sulfurtransferase